MPDQGPASPRPCREEGCDTQIILARSAGTHRWLPFEASDHEPFTNAAAGAWVLVDGIAWKPNDLIQRWCEAFEANETRVRELITGYPAHRLHIHDKDTDR